MSPTPYAVLVLFSVALFVFWGGPLWVAKPGASHVGRFAVSYLAVIPAAALLLLRAHRLTWSHVIAATCSAWGIKLVVTSALYFSLAKGTAPAPIASHLAPTPKPHPAASADYRAAGGSFESGAVSGTVLRAGVPVVGAVVLLDRPSAGLPLTDAPDAVRLTIHGLKHGEGVYLGRADQRFEVASTDAVLHTLHLYEGGRTIANVPVPGGSAPREIPAPETGIYDVRCDTHAAERATLVVVDHPYATRSGAKGEISLTGVPAGSITLVVVPDGDGGSAERVRRVAARVESGETTAVHIDLSTPEVAEERL